MPTLIKRAALPTDPIHLITEPAFSLTALKMGPISTLIWYVPFLGGHCGKKFVAASQPTSNRLYRERKRERKKH